jgi:hypothetical protein
MSLKMIQLKASTQEPLRNITENARVAMSKLCGGIDDMHQLGNKALVIRAEIYPEKLSDLYKTLASAELKLRNDSLPDHNALRAGIEHPITLQITSFSSDTDGQVNIPKVPG